MEMVSELPPPGAIGAALKPFAPSTPPIEPALRLNIIPSVRAVEEIIASISSPVHQNRGRAAVKVVAERVVDLGTEGVVLGEDLMLHALRVLVLAVRVFDLNVDIRPAIGSAGVVNACLAAAQTYGERHRLAGG